MAYANTHYAGTSIRQTLTRPFVAFSNFMDLFAGSVAKANAATHILEMSDAQIAAKGMTRAEAIQSVFK